MSGQMYTNRDPELALVRGQSETARRIEDAVRLELNVRIANRLPVTHLDITQAIERQVLEQGRQVYAGEVPMTFSATLLGELLLASTRLMAEYGKKQAAKIMETMKEQAQRVKDEKNPLMRTVNTQQYLDRELTKACFDMTDEQAEKLAAAMSLPITPLKTAGEKVPKVIEIWAEGHRNVGSPPSSAMFLGRVQAHDLKSACEAWAKEHAEYARYYFNSEELTYGGCRLFDNEADARKSFG
jgi:hypothetical protein